MSADHPRILQVSLKETIAYDMPRAIYETMQDVMDSWHFYHSRRDKCTVEKVIRMLELVMPEVRAQITVTRWETKPEIRGLRGGVWYDEYKWSEETV